MLWMIKLMYYNINTLCKTALNSIYPVSYYCGRSVLSLLNSRLALSEMAGKSFRLYSYRINSEKDQ